MTLLVLFIKLLGIVIIGSCLYYYIAILKIIGIANKDEINASELSISEEGELQEEFPDEILTDHEVKTLNYGATLLFIFLGSLLWGSMGLITGCVAYLSNPPEFFKLLIYLLIYFLFLRFSFGVANKSIIKTFELDTIPEKIIFAIVMISAYTYGINCFENLPSFLKDFLR